MKTPDPAQIDKDRTVMDLRRTGMSFTRIAELTGYADHSGAIQSYERSMKLILKEPTEAVRDLALARLDELLTVAYSKAMAGDLQALQVSLKILERQARLLGLDAPTKVQQEVTTWSGDGEIDAAVRELSAELAKRVASSEDSGSESSMDNSGSQGFLGETDISKSESITSE